MVPPPSSRESVDTLFECWLTELDQGGEDFEAFAAGHAADAADLRRLHAAWRVARSALSGMHIGDTLPGGGASRSAGGHTDGTAEPRSGPRVMLAAGAVVGDYRLVRPLGEGGMGQVWEAEQLSLGRRVALKTVRPGPMPISGARLQHEARAAGGLNHPGIVPVFAAGEAGGVHFVVQQLVGDGTTLADLIDRRRNTGDPSPVKLAALFAEIADALAAAHGAGILHRDLKPRNILIDQDGRPRVCDFGLALRFGDAEAGGLAGTCAYMSPEQADGGTAELDGRSDVFSLGAVLYEALTLRRPFDGETASEVLDAVRHERPEDPARVRRHVPRDLGAVCLKALEKAPSARYADMRAFADDLRRFLAHEPVRARRPSTAGRALRWSRRHPGRAVALLLGGVSLVAVASLLVRESGLRAEAESRAGEARAQGYIANLRAAAMQLQRGNPVEAHRSLSACAPELRRWEWRHAMQFADSAVRLLTGHAGGATAAVLTPDGTRIATGSSDSFVRVWDEAGALLAELSVGHGPIRSVDITDDGRTLAFGADDGVVRLWSPGPGAAPVTLHAHADLVTAVAISSDGRRVVSCARDGTTRVWGMPPLANSEVTTPELNVGVASVAVSAAGSPLVTGSLTGVVTLWPAVATGGGGVTEGGGGVTEGGGGVTEGGGGVTAGGVTAGGTATTGRAAAAGAAVQLHGYDRGLPAVVAVSDDGQRVVAGLPDGTVAFWDGPDWESLGSVVTHGRPVTAVAMSADGHFVVSASAGDEPVAVVDVDRRERVAALTGHGGRVTSLAISADGQRIVTGCADGTAYVWDRRGRQPVRELAAGDARPRSFAVSGDGSAVAFCDGLHSTLTLLRERGATSVDLGPGPLGCVALSDDAALLAAGRADGTVQLMDLRSERRLPELTAGREPVALLALVDHGARVVAAVGNDLVLLDTHLDAHGGAPRVLAAHTAPITGLATSADGRRVASASIDGTVRLWKLADDRGDAGVESLVVRRGEPFDDHVVALDPAGRVLAVAAAAGGAIRIFDADTGALRCELTDLEAGVPSLTFDSGGDRLFTAAYNGRFLRVWDSLLGENLFDFPDPGGGITALAFAAGRVFVAEASGRVLVREAPLR